MIKNKQRRELYTTAKKYLDIKSLFPRSKNIGKAPLTDYQQRKISKEIRALTNLAGGITFLERDFIKINRTKTMKEYLKNAGIPKASKGVLLSGGDKINKKVTIKSGVLFYERGGLATSQYPLDASSERNLKKSMRAKKKHISRPENSSYLATAGGKINNAYYKRRGEYFPSPSEVDGADSDAYDLIEELSLTLYDRYSALAAAGEMRPREKGGRAIHPSKWGMALVIERK